ncbi:NAD(P)/FAD-dependent oxidoreductase [Pseudidiomarina donghaiensis]|jgi:NADH dehydrogenase|uniref:NAD(P)/FAD-dependent oxidoreductase n=1 Tax=Pseudidiomarina donghaiensis TaxID=519452 RepID=A0A432XIC6_9GAMM|nr:NAD(P)/FAD-dependent oxidoreductase [Pseudidiomarina donghaiensis]MBR9907272.1 NAD(P)/FAD-dependent oxidoreductase [Gammaproteobacteria bacterium]RUO48483.1 NAD(P)/FAD-dependent oxidoreductase [Pseudidiomarina donghaiensis]SFV23839.1 NADH dehydrogenase [Pseudidiomarina donghaiensis]
METQHIVVVGGGAGGLELVTKLGRKYKHDAHVSVTLIDRNLTHVWKPLLHEVAAGALDADIDGVDYRVQAAHAHFNFLPGVLCGIDHEKRVINLAAINDDQGRQIVAARNIPFTYLVLAIGSVTNDFGTKGAQQHCFFLDSVKQATRFHHQLMNTFLSLQAEKYPRPLNVAIVGGGATGVELSAELYKSAELIRSYGFSDFQLSQLKITLVEAGPRILPALPERIAAAAQQELINLGVKVRVQTPVVEATEQGLVTQSGELIEATIKVWAAGVKAPEFLAQLGCFETNRANQIVVRPTLQSTTHSQIFVIGDCAAVEQADGSRVPPRAQAAHQMAECAYLNIVAMLKQQPLRHFVYRDHGSLVSLSSYSAVGSLMGNLTRGAMMVEGWLARVMYKSLYRMHQVAVHGYFKTILFILVQKLNRRLKPRLKLH